MRTWRILITGAPGAGKSTLCKALLGHGRDVVKTQAPEYHGRTVVDLPGEYMTHPHLRRVFLAVLQDARLVLYAQAADEAPLGIPPGLLRTLPGVDLMGVVTRIDLPGRDLERSRNFLRGLGIPEPYFEVNALQEESVAPLCRHLRSLGALPQREGTFTAGGRDDQRASERKPYGEERTADGGTGR